MVNLTGTIAGDASAPWAVTLHEPVMMTRPSYVPGSNASGAGARFTLTTTNRNSSDGSTLPDAEARLSHAPPVVVSTVAVKSMGHVPWLPTVRLLGAGFGPPCCAVTVIRPPRSAALETTSVLTGSSRHRQPLVNRNNATANERDGFMVGSLWTIENAATGAMHLTTAATTLRSHVYRLAPRECRGEGVLSRPPHAMPVPARARSRGRARLHAARLGDE